MIKVAYIVLLITGLSTLAYADDYDFDDDFDLELEFGIKQKSTIEDFPMQEVGRDVLSDAAIAGALRATSARDVEQTGKPAYAEQKDAEGKRKIDELDVETDIQRPEELASYGVEVPETPSIPQMPYSAPDNVTYDWFSFKAYERP